MMNMLSVGRSPQNDRKSMDIRYDISVKPNERISANSTVDSLQILINEFGKGIDKRKHGSTITRFDINKKAIILLADLDNHLSNILESRGGSGSGSGNSKVRGDKSTFDFVKVEGVLFKALQCQYVTPCDVLSMRRILCSCLHKLFSIDTQMIAKCATKYVTTLDTLSSSTSSYTTLVGLLYSLCVLCQVACQLMPPLNNMIPLLVKLWKLYSDSIKVAVLELTSAYAANLPRGIVNDWPELIKMAQRGVAERSNEVKKAAGDLSLTIASRVTPDLTQNRNFDTFLSFITKSMDDNYMGVRAAFGCAAGELLCRAISLENNDHDVDVDGGGDGQQDLKRKPSSSSSSSMKHLYTCGYSLILLTSQFSKVGASKDLREAITISVIHFLSKCPESVIEMNIEIIVSNIIGLLGNVKAYITSGDLLQAQMYVSQMIRMGIVHRLDEAGRLAAIKEFTKIISRYTSNQYAMLCLLREIAALCNALGEVVENVRDVVLEAIMISLAHGSDYVRYAGSLTTRSLAASIPTHSISFVSALVNMVQIDHAELVDTPNTKPQEQERIANSLHGHSNALATLIYTSTKRSLTVSHILCSAVLDTALLLGKITPNMSPYVAMRRQEACWVLVCSVLSLSDHWIKLNLDRITELWEKSLGGKSTSKLPTEDTQISSILRAKAAALLSLTIFITTCETLLNEEMLNRIYGYFANTIKLLSTLPQNYKPASSASLYSINILKLYLFELIRRLPTSLLAKPQQKNVVNFVTKLAFAEIDGTHNGVETSLLHTSILAPAIENEMHAVDLFDVLMEDQMRFFSKSGQLYLFSQEHPQFQEITVEADSSCILDDSKLSFFEKPLSLNVRLVDSAIRLLGVLFQYHKATSKSQIIEYFISHIKTTYTLPDDVRLSNTVFSNVIASIYCILLRMKANNNSKSNSSADDTDKNFYSSVHSILTAALGHISQSIRRAASKTLAVLASMIGAAVMEDLLKKCAAKFAKEGPVKSGYSLALGDVNKALGSLSSRNHLPQTVSFLIALARSNSPNTQLCAFQSIWNTIETSGIGFGAHVDSILQQLVFLFFSPIGTPTEQHMNKDDDKHILLGSTRILYAFTALGPDVIERASFKDIFHLLIHDILSSDLTPVQIEATRLIERAILLAPMLIPNLRDIVIGLKRFLQNPSSHSALKRMTANCIKIIAEKEIDLICEIFNPKLLFQLLDQCQEIDEEENGSQFIKQIISLQIQAKSSQCSPKIWIPLIHEIVSSEPRRSRVNDQSVGGLVADTDDMEKNIPSTTATVTTTTTEESFNYSWQVKVFAVNCLLELLDVYKVDDNHVDLKKARDLPNGDYLVQHLTQLIDICSIALNKGTISIKHAGLLGLISILKIFENVPDPDVPDEPLLLQHTAKFGAAISLGFEAKSPPLLCYVACELASIYIPSKLLIGQPNSMARICSYMTDQLPKLGDLNTSQYGEVASTMIKVIILSTLATIYNAADESGNKELFPVLEKDVPLMFTNWQKCLKDYGLISTILSDAASEYANYDHNNNSGHHHHSTTSTSISTAFLEEGTEKSVETYFSSAYPHIINAVTRMSARKYQEYYAMREKNKRRNKNSGEEEEEEVVPLFEYNYDVALVLGIAVRGLYENKKINESTLPTILSCIRSITRLIQSPQYLTLPFAPGATFELFLLLIKMQASREMTLQYACLKLLNTIVTETDMTLFGSSDQISTQAIVTTSTEVCLKPLRMQFPSLFEQDSEQQLMSTNLRMSNNHDELTRERMRLVKQCMSCLKTIVQRFKESVNGASVTTILYSLCRILQFTQSSSCLEVALALSELEVQSSSISTLDETSVWMVAFEAAIENLRLRIRDVKITTPLEVELLFICIASVHKCVVQQQQQQQQQQQLEMKNERQILQFAAINESVIQTLRGILSDPQAVSNAFFVRRVSWVLQGIQNGLLRLAKSTQHSDLALFYMSELSGPVCAYLMKVFNSGRITNEQYENYSEQQQLNEGELIVAVIPAGLNILLTGYSLISDSGKKCSYLRVMIPLLVAMLRMIKTSSTISSEWKHQENLNKIHKLAVQCLERLAQSAAIEFTQVVKSLPPTVVLEIQQEVKKGKERDSHHHHHNHRSAQQQQQQQQKPKQKLEINFDAYVVAKKSQQAQQQQQDQDQPSQQ